jgi:hypothetical protein
LVLVALIYVSDLAPISFRRYEWQCPPQKYCRW